MSKLEQLQEEFDRLNDIIKNQRNEKNRYRNDNATQMALQQRIATLQSWMDIQGYNIDITSAIDENFNEFEFIHKDILRDLQDSIEALSGTRPVVGE